MDIFSLGTSAPFLVLLALYPINNYRKPASRNCGPFQKYKFVYEMVFEGLLQIQEDHGFMKFLLYLTKPGVIMGLLIIMRFLLNQALESPRFYGNVCFFFCLVYGFIMFVPNL